MKSNGGMGQEPIEITVVSLVSCYHWATIQAYGLMGATGK